MSHIYYKIISFIINTCHVFIVQYITVLSLIKGSVQQKLRWVENGVNRCVWAWQCGAGRFYVILLHLQLVFTIFPFLVCTAQVIGEFWINMWSTMSDVAPTVLALYRNIIGATLHPALKGEAGRLCRANKRSTTNSQRQLKVFADFLYSLRFAYWRSTNRRTNSVSAA
jgi:hypothetical protein